MEGLEPSTCYLRNSHSDQLSYIGLFPLVQEPFKNFFRCAIRMAATAASLPL